VDPGSLKVTVYRVWGPNVVATPEGIRRVGPPDEVAFRMRKTVPMDDRPQPGWPCTQQTWATLMRSERNVPIPVPPVFPGGLPEYPNTTPHGQCKTSDGSVKDWQGQKPSDAVICW
jgi:hypothetical protein